MFTVTLTLHTLATATPVAEPQTVPGAVGGLLANATGTVGQLVNGTVVAVNATLGNVGALVNNAVSPIISTVNKTINDLLSAVSPISQLLGIPLIFG